VQDAFNDLEFDFANLQLKYAFKLRHEEWLLAVQTFTPSDTQNWQKYPSIFLRVSGYVTNGVNQYIYQNLSNSILVNDFSETTANATDANIIGEIELFDGATLISDLNGDGLTKVVATFSGTNIYNLGVSNINELWGVIRLDKFNAGGGGLNIREFSTIRLPENNSPFTSLNTSGLAVLQNYTGNTVELVGLLDAQRLSNLGYQLNDCIVISARIGRIQPAVTMGNSPSPCCVSLQYINFIKICQTDMPLPCVSKQYVIVNRICDNEPPTTGNPPVNTTFTQRTVSCGTKITQPANGAGFYVDSMNLGTGTGEVSFNYNAYEVPDRYILELDGIQIFDSGFVSSAFGGSLPYDYFLQTKQFSKSFIDGYTAYYGFAPEAQKITEGNNGTFKFNKTVNAAQTLKIIVYAPLDNTVNEYNVECLKVAPVVSYPDNLCYLPAGYPFVVTNGLASNFAKTNQNSGNKPIYSQSKTNQTLTGTIENWVISLQFNQNLNVWQFVKSVNGGAGVVFDSIPDIANTTTANGWNLSQAECQIRIICYSGNTIANMQGYYSISLTNLFNSELTWLRTVSTGGTPSQFAWRYLVSGWRLVQLNPTQNLNVDNRTTASINIVGLTNNSFSNTDNGTSLNC
jgi:hypothetical protein